MNTTLTIFHLWACIAIAGIWVIEAMHGIR